MKNEPYHHGQGLAVSRQIKPWWLAIAGALAFIGAGFQSAQASGSASLVIAEVYGGGGNSGAPYQNDFVVVFNRGVSNVDVNGWSVQYAPAASATWQPAILASSNRIIPPGGYFLLKLSGGSTGLPLPAEDASAAINLNASAGKVALCNHTNRLADAVPLSSGIVDLVGYGASVSTNEGGLSAPAPSNSTSVQRGNSGCTDTDFNATDFSAALPNPRNSGSPSHACASQPPTIEGLPQSQTNLLSTSVALRVRADGAPPLFYRWRKNGLDLSDGGQVSGSGTSTLTLANLASTNGGDYTVVVMNGAGSVTSSPPATLTVGSSGLLAGWDFNGPFNTAAPAPAFGSSTASAALAGGVDGFISPVASPNDLGGPNFAWGTQLYPLQGTSNKLAGPRFNVSTVGLKNVSVSCDLRASAAASRYQRLQFTTNGSAFVDFPTSSALAASTSYQPQQFSLAGFPGVRNNLQFGIRFVSEFESTATYGVSTNANYAGNTANYDPDGTLSYDLVVVSAQVIAGTNAPPTISGLANGVTTQSSNLVVNFTVADAETPAAALTVVAASRDSNVISSVLVTNTGGGGRALVLGPGQPGVAPIFVTVTDGFGDVATAWFYVTVNPDNRAPIISPLPHTNTLMNQSITLPFAIGDDHTAASNLTISVTSWNSNLVQSVVLGGSGSNRTVKVIPAFNQLGVAPIMVSVSDGPNTTVLPFTVMVRPTTNVFFNDYFEYDAGSLTDVAFGLWQAHSEAGNGPVQAGSSQISLDLGNSEDVNAMLIGQPYRTNGGVALYASFKATFSGLPTHGGGYFAHFKDGHPIDATAGFGCRVWASTLNATSGRFRLGVGNGQSSTNTSGQFPLDLDLGATYLAVTRFDPATGTNSTIWVNPTSESSASVTATNLSTVATQPNPIDVVAYAFRQGGGIGSIAIDDLVIGRSFADVVPALAVSPSGTNAVLKWGNPAFSLQSASRLIGPYTNVAGVATSPYTNPISGPTRFFRLLKP